MDFFISCSDVNCGLLYCEDGIYSGVFGFEGSILNLTYSSTGSSCKYATVDAGI